jgi:glycine/D-amino acid oxidase-like deaminating enzyme
MHTIPTLIIGAGIAGTSLACSLAERGAGQGVAIADLDVFGKYSSSELNGGGVRCTFAEPVNVKLSLASTRYYLQHAAKFDFRQRGYLWLYDDELWHEARAFLPVVRSFELPVEELTREQLKARFPVLDDVSDLAGATFTPFDGRLSPHRLRVHYLDHAQGGGVQLLDRWQVVGVAGTNPPYRVTLRRVTPRGIKRALTDRIALPKDAELLSVDVERLVNAAGPWAPQVARLYGRELPVTPLPRQVFLLHHSAINLEPLPFFIEYPEDIYFRHYERDRRPCVLVSWSDPEQPSGTSFAHEGEPYYAEYVRPRLVRRIAAMVDATMVGGWTGHYELTPDKAAVVGPVPDRPSIYNYNGLSAHGVMQSRALGEAMADYLTRGAWPADLDLSELSEARFAPGRLLGERMYV